MRASSRAKSKDNGPDPKLRRCPIASMRTREVAQHLDLELLLVDQGADEIADADDADDDAVVLDGEVADSVRRHHLHCAAHAILELPAADILVHHLPHLQLPP